ncbi:outer membrane lipoprotein-sorting protein [Aquiflexum sp. LQ15W]|uniref:outer membrane lipoprotein-sorting protein n=1 Tax=Cognataquiflexum nitidum TaxID=2922272 RepID=UPI001F13A2BA|nr:outer membrane lipoprotein-sorting protein [Cognataquiflexum nitidum]MCH6201891.1 outer membrane lipoprotein-sorting protein [Cognataquiflexum nitidum]
MKKSILILSFLCFSTLLHAQKVEDIIDQYLENTGGAAEWAKLSSMKMEGKISAQGMDIPLEIVQTKEGKMYMKFQLQGQEIVQQAFDGTEAWGVNFMTMKAEKSDSETTENMKREMGDFPDPFLNFKSKGYTAELLGEETVEGTECFKVKLTKKPLLVDGAEVENISFYFFDKENFVPIMVEKEMKTGPAKGITIQTLMSDYQEVEGLYFPFSITEKAKGSPQGQGISITKVILNPALDPAAFVYKD